MIKGQIILRKKKASGLKVVGSGLRQSGQDDRKKNNNNKEVAGKSGGSNQEEVKWLVGCVAQHINSYRFFNAKSC